MKYVAHQIIIFGCLLLLLTVGAVSVVFAQTDIATEFSSASESSGSKFAPGEFLPLSIKLVNFGSLQRVDVAMDYSIFDNTNTRVHSERETLAVDTTASFVKRIQLPFVLKPGVYTAVTSLRYPDQKQPAVSKFPFQVEPKIGGVFRSDLLFYALIFVLTLVVIWSLLYLLMRRNSRHQAVFDYSDKPQPETIYYEMLSNIIAQMRLHSGDEALALALNIPDLDIDAKTGRIINIKQDPAKIMALLVARYEKLTGRQLNFSRNQSL